MEPVPEALGVQIFPYKHFRLGVLTLNAGHIEAARFFAVYIGHTFLTHIRGYLCGKPAYH